MNTTTIYNIMYKCLLYINIDFLILVYGKRTKPMEREQNPWKPPPTQMMFRSIM